MCDCNKSSWTPNKQNNCYTDNTKIYKPCNNKKDCDNNKKDCDCKKENTCCVNWTSLDYDFTQSVLEYIEKTIQNPHCYIDGSLLVIPFFCFMDCVIKKIAKLDISLCSKQNFIRSLMDITFPDVLGKYENGFTFDALLAFMYSVFLTISVKWTLYIDTELRSKCFDDCAIKSARKCFFEEILCCGPTFGMIIHNNTPLFNDIYQTILNCRLRDYVKDKII